MQGLLPNKPYICHLSRLLRLWLSHANKDYYTNNLTSKDNTFTA